VFNFEFNFKLFTLLYTVNSLFSGMYGGRGMLVISNCISKALTELNFYTISTLFKSSDISNLCLKIKITSFHFSSRAGIFLGHSGLMGERFQMY
jgi:hypothetical protein